MSQRLRSHTAIASRFEQDFARVFAMRGAEDVEPKIGWAAPLVPPGEELEDDPFAEEPVEVFTTAAPRAL